MSKQYDSGQTLQQKIAKGIDILADNVAATMGPRGRNVILHKAGSNPIITKDGVTVAKFVDLEDPFENVGVQILKQVADQPTLMPVMELLLQQRWLVRFINQHAICSRRILADRT